MEPSLSDIIIDPEFKALIPPLSASERAGLEANLLADGCVSPLVVWQDQNILLDGHNRYEICRRHNIACKFYFITLESRDAAKAWIIKHQLGRRNLKESQRAMLAATLKEMFTAGAMQRKADGRRAGGRARQGDSSLVSNLTPSCKARDEAAAAMNVSSGLVHAAEKVKSAGSEKLQQTVMAGEASVSAAAQLVSLPKQEQDRIADQGGKAIAQAAQKIRRQHRPAAKGISPQAMKPVRDSQPLPPKTALELPHDPLWAAKTLISVFDREFLAGLVVALTNHLQGDCP
jgi:hypothetical protein